MNARTAWPADLADRRAELDAILAASPLLRTLGGRVAGWGPGWSEVRLPTRESFANIEGTVHGGIIASVADAAFEVACNSHGRVAVATALSCHYTAPAAPGVELVASAAEVDRGRRTASYRIEVETADGGRVAWFQALAYRTSRWHLGEARWPDEWRRDH